MTTVNQKEYLKKYLSIGSEPGKKKKKKKKSSAILDRVKIIDDDIDVTFNQAVEEDLQGLNEDAPQIVGVIDERPLELRIDDYRKSDLWKPLGSNIEDEAINRNLTREESSRRIQNTDDKLKDDYSPPRKRKNIDDDHSPIRRRSRFSDSSPSRRTRGDDVSPVRRSKNESPRRYRNDSPNRRNKDDDISPTRRNTNDSSKRYRNDSPNRRNKDDNDISPPRRSGRDFSPNRKHKNDDISPIRRNKDDDISPPRRNKQDLSPNRRYSDGISPGKRNRNDSPNRKTKDNDMSPPRRSRQDERNNRSRHDSSSYRKNYNSNRRSRDDISPFRRNRNDNTKRRSRRDDISPIRKNRKDSSTSSEWKSRDTSPSRRNRDLDRNKRDGDSGRKSSRGDISPARRNRRDDLTPPRRNRSPIPSTSRIDRSPARRNDDPPRKSEDRQRHESPKRETPQKRKSRWDCEEVAIPVMPVIPIIKKSGLQRANELMLRDEFVRKNMEEASTSVGNLAPIVRDRKTGKIRDFQQEAEEAMKKQEEENELKAKYDKWGKGLKQVEDAMEKLSEDLHEMNKPLARYADDEDLERHLKEMERDGDPMLAFLRKKRKKMDVEMGKPVKPQFEGEFMPNRYGIRPGHRWDGVDRSNGYEKKWFEVMNSRRAQLEDAYKWSTEDM